MMLSQLTFRESESVLTKAGAARRGDFVISFGPRLLGVRSFYFSEWLSLTFKVNHDPCVGKRSDHSRGDGSGRMEDREEEEGKGLVMWFCVGQDCPPS